MFSLKEQGANVVYFKGAGNTCGLDLKEYGANIV